MSSSLRKRTGLALLAAASLASAACGGGGGTPGVGVKDISADIAFGIKEPDKAGANVVNPTVTNTEVEADETVELAVEGPQRRLRPRINPATEVCPKAKFNAFPKKSAELETADYPDEGLYRWKRSGTLKLTDLKQVMPLTGFEERIIRDVTLTQEEENPANGEVNRRYSYFMIVPNEAIGGTTELSFQVVTNSPAAQEVNTQTGQQARAGEPERGLVLKGRNDYPASGRPTQTRFANGLLLLPLPVVPGEEFTSTAAGSAGGVPVSLTYQAKVIEKRRIDACGEVTDGWYVEGVLRDNNKPQQEPTQYNIIVATQYGAVLINEYYKFSDSEGDYESTFTLGQVSPSAGPESG